MMDEVQRKLSVAEHSRPSSEPHRTKQIFITPPKCPDHLWSPQSFLLNGY